MFQEFYSKLTEKEKKVFYAAILFGVLALFDMLFLRPFLSRIHVLDEEIVEKRNALRQDLRFLAYRDKIANEQVVLSTFETDEAKTEEEIIAEFLKTVELLASEAKVNLSKINPAEAKTKKGVVEYFAVLECEGRLEDVMGFMHKIDETKNLLKVVKVDLSGSKTSPDSVKASMKLVKLIIDPKTIGNYQFTEEEASDITPGFSTSPSGAKKSPGEAGVKSSERTSGEDAMPQEKDNSEGPNVPGSSDAANSSAEGTGAAAGAADGGNEPAVKNSSGSETVGEKDGTTKSATGEDLLIGKENITPKKAGAPQAQKQPVPDKGKIPVDPKNNKASKLQNSLTKVQSGGRVKVESLDSLWARFFGKKEAVDAEPADEALPAEEEDPNLWRKKFQGR